MIIKVYMYDHKNILLLYYRVYKKKYIYYSYIVMALTGRYNRVSLSFIVIGWVGCKDFRKFLADVLQVHACRSKFEYGIFGIVHNECVKRNFIN